MSFGKRLGIIFLVLVAAHGVSRSTGYTEDFYKGKTIRIVVATTPGGGFDAYSRMIHGFFKADPLVVNKLRELLK